jgi:hypothetical protein
MWHRVHIRQVKCAFRFLRAEIDERNTARLCVSGGAARQQ